MSDMVFFTALSWYLAIGSAWSALLYLALASGAADAERPADPDEPAEVAQVRERSVREMERTAAGAREVFGDRWLAVLMLAAVVLWPHGVYLAARRMAAAARKRLTSRPAGRRRAPR